VSSHGLLVANCPELPATSDLSGSPSTQEGGVWEFANRISAFNSPLRAVAKSTLGFLVPGQDRTPGNNRETRREKPDGLRVTYKHTTELSPLVGQAFPALVGPRLCCQPEVEGACKPGFLGLCHPCMARFLPYRKKVGKPPPDSSICKPRV
jgi:hypothetical protein